MSIRLTWRGDNAAIADNIIIYRDTVPILAEALPAPLATLAGNAVTYDDIAVVRGTVYYYRMAAVKGDDVMLTDNQIHGYFPDSGPGPQKIIRGDWKRGYFGRVPVSDFLTVAEARTLCGLTVGSAIGEVNVPNWFKFIIDGKIIFAPAYVLTVSVTWQQLYAAGLIYGTDDFGSAPPSVTGITFNVNQKKVVSAKGYNFLVRCPKANAGPTNTLLTQDSHYVGGEWFETMCRLCFATTRTDIKPKMDDYLPAGFCAMTQNFTSTSGIVVIGNQGNADVYSSLSYGASNVTYGWFPFFELQY